MRIRIKNILTLCALCLCGGSALACGTERWAVKTLADAQASAALAAPAQSVLFAELTTKAAPDRGALQGAAATRFPDELSRYELTVLVLGFKLESDGDFHVVLADVANRKRTLIAEIPDPACVPAASRQFFAGLRAKFVQQIGKPSAKFRRLRQPLRVDVIGVGFFDFLHGQTGVAPNGFELHPLLDFSLLQPAPVPASWETADWLRFPFRPPLSLRIDYEQRRNIQSSASRKYGNALYLTSFGIFCTWLFPCLSRNQRTFLRALTLSTSMQGAEVTT